jgi:general secretion pathway protein G
VYRLPGSKNPNGYDIFSYGLDGSESGDDIGNWQAE